VTQNLIARAAYWAGWWAAFFLLWLLLTTLTLEEVFVGGIAAAIAASAAEAVRANDRLRFRPRARWLLRSAPLPWRVIRETWLVSIVLWRRLVRGAEPASAFRALPFAAGGDDARASARRALVEAALSAAPNTVVIGIDRDEDLILLHQLVPPPRGEALDDLRRSL